MVMVMGSGISALLLVFLLIPICILAYIVLKPHVDRANDQHFEMMKRSTKEASRKGQYLVYKTDVWPNSAFGFIVIMVMITLGLIAFFTLTPETEEFSVESILLYAGIIVCLWALIAVGYILAMRGGRDELYFVSERGIERKVLDSKGETSKSFAWTEIDSISVNRTDDEARFTLTIFWTDDDRVDVLGNWVNVDILCRDLLANRPTDRFTKKALDILTRSAAQAGKAARIS